VTLTRGDELAARIETLTPTLRTFECSSEVLRALEAGDQIDDFTAGLAAFIVNRCSRSGMVTSRLGPIGGKHQSGRWHVGSRYSGLNLAHRIRWIAANANHIRFTEGDAIDTIAGLADSGIDDEVLVFADPPYIAAGPALYTASFTLTDHLTLASKLAVSPTRWVLTYDAHPLIDATLYAGYRILEYAIPHTDTTSTANTSSSPTTSPYPPTQRRSPTRWPAGSADPPERRLTPGAPGVRFRRCNGTRGSITDPGPPRVMSIGWPKRRTRAGQDIVANGNTDRLREPPLDSPRRGPPGPSVTPIRSLCDLHRLSGVYTPPAVCAPT
jgi:site-specific DNA-adenine methylase